ncbi:hypothetical protein CCY01nite_07900 [Chitinophaga cymbidii]|uniref:DUF4105 domain-containing protein n=1 Tax=Chitinophaga cymbidii TaxID=1096750 RepID=A0A512RFP6_9BACT|nr:hypothetical protein CCY01nite_07900 [Chitinophaga cymbidii]
MNGKLIRRTIGFYAQTPIDPMKKKSGASMLGDDAGRKYDIKWETYVGGDQLSEMLSGAIHYAGTYHIENYNCANFVLDILSMGGIQLPRTEGWWITGRGLNPGNLGEDIRQLPGSVGMKGNSPDNAGTCQPPKVFF